MEIYNQLISEFHDTQTQQPQLLQLKSISDELFRNRAAKKMHYLNKKQELKQIQRQQESDLSQSRLSASFRCSTSRSSFRSLDTSRQDLVSLDKEELKKKIEQLQKQISVLKDKTHTINNELSIFSKKQNEVDVVNKRSELDVFNSVQVLYLQASRQNQEEVKEDHILKQLQHRRQVLAEEITELCQSLKNDKEIIKKWQESKERKIQTSKYIGPPSDNFQEITITMLKLDQMIAQSKNDLKKKEEKMAIIEQLETKTNKLDIISFLKNHQLKLNKPFADQIIDFYRQLQNEFDRNERANKQINSYLQTLNVKNDQLTDVLDKNNRHTEKRTKQHLKKTQFNLKQLEQSLNSKCKLMTNFTNQFYFLLKRMQSLKKTVNDILTRSSSKISNSGDDGDSSVVSYDEKLNKNLEDYTIRWFQSTGCQSTFYHDYIQPNDMLRLFSCPESYNSGVDHLINYEMFMTGGFRCIHDYSKKMSKQALQFFNFCKISKQRSQKNLPKLENNEFCVESMDYYRRDNYKLLEKMQKNELKKKGLLVQIPFNICIDNELIEKKEEKNGKTVESLRSPESTDRNRRYMKYTDLATKRQERSLKSSAFRNLFSRLDSLRNRSSSRFLNLTSLKQSRSTLNISKQWPNSSLKRVSLPRNTVGTLRKNNSQYR